MILDRIVKLGFSIAKGTVNGVNTVIPYGTMAVKKVKDFGEAEFKNAVTEYKEQDMSSHRETTSLVIEHSKEIMLEENTFLRESKNMELPKEINNDKL